MDQIQLKNELIELTLEQINWFAIRSILRVLPVLAHQRENVTDWCDKPAERIFAVFRACNASIAILLALNIKNINTAHAPAARAAARAAAADDDNTSAAAFAAAFAADAAAFAADVAATPTYTYTDTAARNAAARYAAIRNAAIKTYTDDDEEADVRAAHGAYRIVAKAAEDNYATAVAHAADAAYTAYTAYATAHPADAAKTAYATTNDIKVIKSEVFQQWPDLWHGRTPNTFKQMEFTFLTWLRDLGLDFWAEAYQNWLLGRFDGELIERCLFMQESTIKAGPRAMLAYLKAESLTRTAEARVIFLGEGGAGKTTLIRLLFGEEVQANEPATPRVEIRKRVETIAGSDTLVHYWDFGGQVVMHATHQFFLREKSVYVVVLDIRRGDDLEYWLDHVRVFAARAPTLIVLNKIDLLPMGMAIRPLFDLAAIRRRYPFVLDAVYYLSCETGDGVDSFGSILRHQIAASHILSPDMPLEWFQVKEALALENQDFISRRRFDEICHSKKLAGEEAETALRVLDILGVAIHFPNLIRHRDVVLNPEWITKALYEIIWASEREHCNGMLDVQLVRKIFDDARADKRLDIEVPDDKYDFLLDLMTEFKLAFKSEARGRYCAPMLAQTDEPPHEVAREGGLQCIFHLPFLPPGLFYRFIAESGKELMGDMIWKVGAILTHGKNRVLVEYSQYQRTITFCAHGPKPGLYLTTLRQRLMQLMGEGYKDLVFEPYIIAPDGERISWREMTRRYCMEGESAKVYTDRSEYAAKELLEVHFGKFDNELKLVKNELELLRLRGEIMDEKFKSGISVVVNPVISPTMQNTTTVDVKVKVNADVQNLIHFASSLEMIKEAIDDFKNDEPTQAAEHEKDLNQLCRDIERILIDIEKAKAPDASEVEKKPLMGRIKDRWDNFAERAKQCYYVSDMGEKVFKAGICLAAIDWHKWLDKLKP